MLLIPTTARAAPPARYWLLLALALTAIKLVAGLADPTLRFFLGDSESYLHSALTGWVPPDRSYLYGRFNALSAVLPGSLYGLLVAQSLCGVLTCLLVTRIACVDLGADRRLAAALALLLALEPAQLFYERMVMAESLGTLCLVSMLACGFAYLQRQWWPWLLAVALAGIATVALRMSLLPVVLGFALLPPLVCLARANARVLWRRIAAHALIALAATFIFHNAYQYWYGRMSEGPRAYLQSSGTFRLGLVAPLVKPEHLAAVGLAPELLQTLKHPLADPHAREAHLWMDGGLIAVLREASGAQTEANARKIASRALRDDLPGFLRLAWLTTLDYFDSNQTGPRMQDDLGVRPLNEGIVTALRENLAYDGSRTHEQRNLAARYFEHGGYWLIVCLFALAPLSLLALLRSRPQRRSAALLLCLTALGMVAGQLLFSHIVSFRYLHPFAPVLLLCLSGVLSPGPRRDSRSALI
jgi:Dolichyl-phosphate-mannose-protein mannosyltransferase